MKILFIILFIVVVLLFVANMLKVAKKPEDIYEYMDELTRGRGGKWNTERTKTKQKHKRNYWPGPN